MKNFLKKIKVFLPKLSPGLILGLILFLAAFLRFSGLNWDQGQHLHPDERFLTMVAVAIKIPESLADYLNPEISPMNPYNAGYRFFVYGTFPLNLTKIVAEATGNNSYANIHFVGRMFSVLFDLGVVFLVFKIGQKIFNEKAGLWAAFFYSLMVLPIQLSHFFAVDTFLNFFLILSFYCLILLISQLSLLAFTSLGTFFGLALACKISAVYFLPVIGLTFLSLFIKKPKTWLTLLVFGVVVIFFCLVFLRVKKTQAFLSGNLFNWQINPQFLANLKELKTYSDPTSWFPPSIQWKKTAPLLFPLKNLLVWGLGLPLGLVSLAAFFATGLSVLQKLKQSLKISRWSPAEFFLALIWLWIIGLFVYQGIQFVKTMRYFLPIYPFLALLAGVWLNQQGVWLKKHLGAKLYFPLTILFFSLLSIYPLSFMAIYHRPVTRVTASEWIYQNVPSGSTLGNEHWDDPLPLPLSQKPPAIFKGETLELYQFDTPEKWQKLSKQLQKTDFLILSSNRLYGSIPKVPEKYPTTAQYYQSLFDGSLGFKKVAEFASYPCFPPVGKTWFCFNDDGAEEAFSVYDHPKVIIFQKIQK
jgi:hypothetical protein